LNYETGFIEEAFREQGHRKTVDSFPVVTS